MVIAPYWRHRRGKLFARKNDSPYTSPESSVTSQAIHPHSKSSMLFAATAISFAEIPFAFAVFGTIMGSGLPEFILDIGFLATLSGISIFSGLSPL